MARDPWRYTVAGWLLLLLLARAYPWARWAALGLSLALVGATLAGVVRVARATRVRHDQWP